MSAMPAAPLMWSLYCQSHLLADPREWVPAAVVYQGFSLCVDCARKRQKQMRQLDAESEARMAKVTAEYEARQAKLNEPLIPRPKRRLRRRRNGDQKPNRGDPEASTDEQ